MSVALLDVNVLLALVQEFHIFHKASKCWFREHAAEGWASCAITEAGLVRLAAASRSGSIPVSEGLRALSLLCEIPKHEFWALDNPVHSIREEIRERLSGHQQITDALLLDLAIRRAGRLVTFDKRLRNLLPPDSPHQAAIEVIEP